MKRERIPGELPLIKQRGVIGIVSGDRSTYPQFSSHLLTVQVTPGSVICWELSSGGGIAEARNKIVRMALQQRYEWIWFVDDDHVFGSDILGRLLKHDVDIVVPHVLQRVPPHRWVAWEHFPVTGDMSDDDMLRVWRTHPNRPTLAPGQKGLVELGHCGTGGMLVNTDVFRAMKDPWFEMGRVDAASAGEDTWFSLKARRLGFRMFCDVDAPMGHLATFAVWPVRDKSTQRFTAHIEPLAQMKAPRVGQGFDDESCPTCSQWMGTQ